MTTFFNHYQMSTDYQNTPAKKFINAILLIHTKGLHKEDVWLP